MLYDIRDIFQKCENWDKREDEQVNGKNKLKVRSKQWIEKKKIEQNKKKQEEK